jgi:predicted membrane protein
MRTHWEQGKKQKKVPLLLLLLPFTKPKRKKNWAFLHIIGCIKLFKKSFVTIFNLL